MTRRARFVSDTAGVPVPRALIEPSPDEVRAAYRELVAAGIVNVCGFDRGELANLLRGPAPLGREITDTERGLAEVVVMLAADLLMEDA